MNTITITSNPRMGVMTKFYELAELNMLDGQQLIVLDIHKFPTETISGMVAEDKWAELYEVQRDLSSFEDNILLVIDGMEIISDEDNEVINNFIENGKLPDGSTIDTNRVTLVKYYTK